MPKAKPKKPKHLGLVLKDAKYAQQRLIEIAKTAGWEISGSPFPDHYLEERIRDWLLMKETLHTLRRIMT